MVDDDRQPTAPSDDRRATVVLGVVLVAIGVIFLAAGQLDIDVGQAGWPLFVILPGIGLFVLALLTGGSAGGGMAIAGGITTATGLLLAWQNATGLWATWAYAWTLVAPGGAGLGLFVYGLLARQPDAVTSGRSLLLIGLGLFIGFAFFFEVVIGLSRGRIVGFDTILPLALVVLGGLIVANSLFGRRRV